MLLILSYSSSSQYYKYCHVIDDYNNLCQDSLNLEGKLKTVCWKTRVFPAILGMTLVDAYQAYRYENKLKSNLLEFDDFVIDVSLQFCPITNSTHSNSIHSSILKSLCRCLLAILWNI